MASTTPHIGIKAILRKSVQSKPVFIVSGITDSAYLKRGNKNNYNTALNSLESRKLGGEEECIGIDAIHLKTHGQQWKRERTHGYSLQWYL